MSAGKFSNSSFQCSNKEPEHRLYSTEHPPHAAQTIRLLYMTHLKQTRALCLTTRIKDTGQEAMIMQHIKIPNLGVTPCSLSSLCPANAPSSPRVFLYHSFCDTTDVCWTFCFKHRVDGAQGGNFQQKVNINVQQSS